MKKFCKEPSEQVVTWKTNIKTDVMKSFFTASDASIWSMSSAYIKVDSAGICYEDGS